MHISNVRDQQSLNIKDINLFLASTLVMGLASQPTIDDYFYHDPQGIAGNLWMQQHFTKNKWYNIHTSVHIDHRTLLSQVRTNAQSVWSPFQRLVIDEMMVPFQGKWKYRQCVKGKPHNTGMYNSDRFF